MSDARRNVRLLGERARPRAQFDAPRVEHPRRADVPHHPFVAGARLADEASARTPEGGRAPRAKSLWALALRQRSVWLRALKLGLSVGVLQAAIIGYGARWIAWSSPSRSPPR